MQIFLLCLLNFTARFGFDMRRIFWFKSLYFSNSHVDKDLRQQMQKIMLKNPHSHVELTVPYPVALFYLIKEEFFIPSLPLLEKKSRVA